MFYYLHLKLYGRKTQLLSKHKLLYHLKRMRVFVTLTRGSTEPLRLICLLCFTHSSRKGPPTRKNIRQITDQLVVDDVITNAMGRADKDMHKYTMIKERTIPQSGIRGKLFKQCTYYTVNAA